MSEMSSCASSHGHNTGALQINRILELFFSGWGRLYGLVAVSTSFPSIDQQSLYIFHFDFQL